MNNKSRVPWLQGLIVMTVWPYLTRLESRLAALSKRVLTAGGAVAAQPAAALPARVTQQVAFTSASTGPATFVGLADTTGSMKTAQLLYRARGGEVLKSFILSQPSSQEGDVLVVEIIRGTALRASYGSFPVPVRASLDGSGSFRQTETKPATLLSKDDCLYAYIVEGVVGVVGDDRRLDGTLEIERDAIIS